MSGFTTLTVFVPVFVILSPSYLIFPTAQGNLSKPACMNLKISSSQCLGVNWWIPSWRNKFQLHLVLNGSMRTDVNCFNSQLCIPLSPLHPTLFEQIGCSVFNHTTALVEILQLRSSCSMPVCPLRHATRGCASVFGRGLAKRFRGKSTPSVACISVNQYGAGLGRVSSNSWIMTCSNERENSSNWLHLSHISHNKRPFVSSSSSIPFPSSWRQPECLLSAV